MYDPTKPYKKEILRLIESTWQTPYVKVTRGLYPIIEKKFSLLKECSKRKTAITGGETSIHSNGDSMDISITVCGFLKKMRENQCKVGDVLIGIKSNGLHSNGTSKVREVFGKEYRKECIAPTAIYLEEILKVLEKHQVHGMMHITGDAFSKLKDILEKADVRISVPKKLWPREIFSELYSRGVSSREMYTIFNCGVGFVLSVPKKEAAAVLSQLKNAAVIGEVVKGTGKVFIESAFDGKEIML